MPFSRMKRQSWAQKLVEEMAEACGSWLTVHSCCRCLFLVGLLSLHCQPSCTGESTFGLYMYISCKGTQNLRYPNAVEKFFSLHGSGLRLISKEYMPSHITKSFTLRTEQLFPYRPTQGWTVGEACLLGKVIGFRSPSSLGLDGDGTDCAPLPSLPVWL